jgi:hypothetical protein
MPIFDLRTLAGENLATVEDADPHWRTGNTFSADGERDLRVVEVLEHPTHLGDRRVLLVEDAGSYTRWERAVWRVAAGGLVAGVVIAAVIVLMHG